MWSTPLQKYLAAPSRFTPSASFDISPYDMSGRTSKNSASTKSKHHSGCSIPPTPSIPATFSPPTAPEGNARSRLGNRFHRIVHNPTPRLRRAPFQERPEIVPVVVPSLLRDCALRCQPRVHVVGGEFLLTGVTQVALTDEPKILVLRPAYEGLSFRQKIFKRRSQRSNSFQARDRRSCRSVSGSAGYSPAWSAGAHPIAPANRLRPQRSVPTEARVALVPRFGARPVHS
jgi:hypothetical protein